MMVEKLVLHIGATKTGTSAIQSALACDREALLANGVLYPEDEATDGKAQAGRVSGGNGALFRGLYGLDPKSSQKALKKFEESIRSLVSPRRSVARPPSVVVFSHERIGGIDPKLLAALKGVFSRHFDHVQIIYYVRHLADHAISQYGEYVKRRRMKESFNNFAPKYQARFKKTMETYESVFDPNDIQYVLYDDVRDNLYRDFLQRIGVRSDPNYRDPEQVNRSAKTDSLPTL